MSLTKTDKKYHILTPDFEAGHNGTGPNALHEPVPNFKARPGDSILSSGGFKPGVDNNAIIIFGRDRDPYRPTKDGLREKSGDNPLTEENTSGYSDYMGAGAIDIVVGRGAPFPTPGVGAFPNDLPPLYLTRPDDRLKAIQLRDGEFHPAYMMDAARIYISQMCDVDDTFAIKKVDELNVDDTPCSTIVSKADRLRMHARRDIKIVAGGDKGTEFDSNGFRINQAGYIHLIAGNGTLGAQQPVPLGDNLVACLNEILKSIQSVSTILNNFMKTQKEVNDKMSKHFHTSGTGATTWDPLVAAECLNADMSIMEDKLQCFHEKTTNITSLINDYLTSGGDKYINSYYVTTT